MKDGPSIAAIAAAIGDPARANMLTVLLDGRALTVSELAEAAGIALPTASEHLARLAAAGLVIATKQGRHRYYRLAESDVAVALETLMGIAERVGPTRVRAGPRDAALREARVCYDHLAGERAVRLADALAAAKMVAGGNVPVVTVAGRAWLGERGIVLGEGRRPECRHCLDWSERRYHLAGRLGSAILERVLAEAWARRGSGRVIAFSTRGGRAFDAAFGLADTSC